MATFKLKLDKRFKIGKDKFHLTVRVINKSEVIYLKLDTLMTAKEFDIYFVKQSFDPTIVEVRTKFNCYVERAYKVFESVQPFELKKFKESFYDTKLNLNKVITGEDRENGTMKFLFENYNKQRRAINKIGLSTMDLLTNTLNSIHKFGGEEITYKEITPEWLSLYENWFLNKVNSTGKKNSIASFSSICRNIRAVLKFSLKKRIIPSTYEYPFDEYQIPNYIPPKSVISLDEIQRIIDLDDFNDRWEEYARDIWVLLYRMKGINFIDLLKLRWSDKVGNHFIFFRQKTIRTRRHNIRPIRIKITDKIQASIDKIGKTESHFVFGLINEENYTEQYLKNRNHKLKGRINRYLKIIGQRLNLSMSLDISLARDSYANTLKRKNVNPLVISENMNHSDPRTTTLHYLDQFEQDVLDDANDLVL